MAPRTRKPAEKTTETDEASAPVEPRHAKTVGQICPLCWPKGWRTEATTSANCIHGSWKR